MEKQVAIQESYTVIDEYFVKVVLKILASSEALVPTTNFGVFGTPLLRFNMV